MLASKPRLGPLTPPARRVQRTAILLLRYVGESKIGGVMGRTLGRASLGVFAAFTLIASGCASLRPYDPGPGRRAAAGVVRDSYLPGEPVNVTIANLSEVMLFYPDGFCKTELQKKERGGWLTVSDAAKTCSAEAGMLDPTQTVVHQFRLPSGLAS